MGNIIESYQLEGKEEMFSRLLIYTKKSRKMMESKSVSKDIADGLLACRPKRRSIKLEQILNSVLDKYSDGVTIKDIDVLFNPEYEVDVLKILISARKRKNFSVIWPGEYKDGKLRYGEEGYPDYKVFNILDCDITYVK